MRKKSIAMLLVVSLLTLTLAGCQNGDGLDPKKPVTVTMWHNYSGETQVIIDSLVEQFNSGIGKEKGIIISITSISSQIDHNEKLTMIANGDPGAPEMPDITTLYPKLATLLNEKGLLAPLDGLFSEADLAAYLPQFIREGRLADGKLYVFPIAKSTEVFYLNQTLFDRFSAATGVSADSLSTFEGIAEASISYYEWTDSLTPDIPDDGKLFYAADSWFNVAEVGTKQLGGEFVEAERLLVDAASFERIWNMAAAPTVAGGCAIVDGYSSALLRTGEIVCSTGSSAAVLYCVDSITYPDNTTEAVEFKILPYPVFEGGEEIALQRGGGLAVAKSTPAKEKAAAIFIQWLTQPEQNMRFVATTGYLPVTREAFDKSLSGEGTEIENRYIKMLLAVFADMHKTYTFLIPPNYDSFDALSRAYDKNIDAALAQAREEYLAGDRSESALNAIMEKYLQDFRAK